MVASTPGSRQLAAWRLRQQLGLKSLIPLRTLGARFTDAFGILTYHRVSWQCRRDPAMLNVHPRTFRDHIEGLLALGYEPWPLSKVLDYRADGIQVPRKAFLVVFDDGYENVFLNAWPTLQKLRVPATIFLATAYLDSDHPFPFDTTAELSDGSGESWRPLSTDQCREMTTSGLVELGSHTHTHADFSGCSGVFQRDLRRSIELLSDRFEVTRPAFSFPFGRSTASLTKVVRDLGCSCGLTSVCELVRGGQSPFGWGRFGATDLDTATTLAGKLDGWYSFLQATWRGMRPDFGLR